MIKVAENAGMLCIYGLFARTVIMAAPYTKISALIKIVSI